MDSGVELKISVLDAMQRLKIVWEKVTSTTIVNCFHHCNFNTEPTEDSTEDAEPEMNDLLSNLRQRGMEVEGQFEDFSGVDVATAGILSEEEIAGVFQVEPQDTAAEIEDAFDEPILCPNIQECQSALGIIRRFTTCKGDSSHLNAINCLDELVFSVSYSCSKQAKITDFFQQ